MEKSTTYYNLGYNGYSKSLLFNLLLTECIVQSVCASNDVPEIIDVDLSVFISIDGLDQNLEVFIGDLVIPEFTQNIAENADIDKAGVVGIEYGSEGFLDGVKVREFVVAENGV